MSDPVLPMGHTAVMAGRQATDTGDLDYFPTPPWGARAGAELIKRLDPGAVTVWEPACGGGHMAFALADYFDFVLATDINDYGFGQGGVDFLAAGACPDAVAEGDVDWIVTNPPFVLGEAFVRTAYQRARRGVAMLLRLQFIEGNARHALFTKDCPLTVLAPFSERVPMVKGRWDPDASSATAYAWFVFQKGAPTAPPIVQLIPPGSKERLTRPGDRARFGIDETADMFGEVAA